MNLIPEFNRYPSPRSLIFYVDLMVDLQQGGRADDGERLLGKFPKFCR